jgi:hypothetical protein
LEIAAASTIGIRKGAVQMRKFLTSGALAVLLAGFIAGPALAQQTEGPRVLEVGEMAPDFELIGATRYGTLRDPVRLSDYKGKTIVLAFFFRVRTRG